MENYNKLEKLVRALFIKFNNKFNNIVKLDEDMLQKVINYIINQGNCHSYPLEIAEILLGVYPNNNAFIAALLSASFSEVSEETAGLELQKIKDDFGIEVANIVDGIIQLSKIHYLPCNTVQEQKFIDLLFSLQEDIVIKVLFVKLSYLLHHVSIFNLMKVSERKTITVLEIMEIYIPLAEKIGMEEIKNELQDLCLTFIQYNTREYILKHLSVISGNDGQTLINEIASALHNSLNALDIKAEIFGRVKTPYSIWLKMLQKNVSIYQLYDILAFRIIVENIEQCYKVLDIVHRQYQIVTGHFEDYIRRPKANGYQSLHTVIIDSNKKNIEIQIRTQAMDKIAKHGDAAHWEYKKKPSIIRERIYNICFSLYNKTVHLLFANISKIRDRYNYKQYLHELSILDNHKQYNVMPNIESRFLLNYTVTSSYHNTINVILGLLESSGNLDLLKASPGSYDEGNMLRIKFTSYQVITDLLELYNTNKNPQMSNQQKDTYKYNCNNTISGNYIVSQLQLGGLQLRTRRESWVSQIEDIEHLLTNNTTKFTTNPSNQRINNYYNNKIEVTETTTSIQKEFLIVKNGVSVKNVQKQVSERIIEANQRDTLRQKLSNMQNIKDLIAKPYEGVQKEAIHHSLTNCTLIIHNGLPVGNAIDINQHIIIHDEEEQWYGRKQEKPFLVAVQNGVVAIIQAFLTHPQLDINQRNSDEQTALIIAAIMGNAEAFKLLITYLQDKNDIDSLREYINFKDIYHHTALYYAIYHHFAHYANYALVDTAMREIVQALISLKDNDGQYLVEEFRTVNTVDENGDTNLSLAIQEKDIQKVNDLLSIISMLHKYEGYNLEKINAKNYADYTLLKLALLSNNIEIILSMLTLRNKNGELVLKISEEEQIELNKIFLLMVYKNDINDQELVQELFIAMKQHCLPILNTNSSRINDDTLTRAIKDLFLLVLPKPKDSDYKLIRSLIKEQGLTPPTHMIIECLSQEFIKDLKSVSIIDTLYKLDTKSQDERICKENILIKCISAKLLLSLLTENEDISKIEELTNILGCKCYKVYEYFSLFKNKYELFCNMSERITELLYTQILDEFGDKKNDYNMLSLARKVKDYRRFEELVKVRKLNINCESSKDGGTVFFEAVIHKDLDLINRLLTFKDDNGNYLVDINYRWFGETVLIHAAKEGDREIVKILVALKDIDGNLVVDPNIQDMFGNTALGHAAREGHSRIVKILVTLKDNNGSPIVNINNIDEFKKTVMHYFQSDNSMKQFLREHGAQELEKNNTTVEDFIQDNQSTHSKYVEQKVSEIISNLRGEFQEQNASIDIATQLCEIKEYIELLRTNLEAREKSLTFKSSSVAISIRVGIYNTVTYNISVEYGLAIAQKMFFYLIKHSIIEKNTKEALSLAWLKIKENEKSEGQELKSDLVKTLIQGAFEYSRDRDLNNYNTDQESAPCVLDDSNNNLMPIPVCLGGAINAIISTAMPFNPIGAALEKNQFNSNQTLVTALLQEFLNNLSSTQEGNILITNAIQELEQNDKLKFQYIQQLRGEFNKFLYNREVHTEINDSEFEVCQQIFNHGLPYYDCANKLTNASNTGISDNNFLAFQQVVDERILDYDSTKLTNYIIKRKGKYKECFDEEDPAVLNKLVDGLLKEEFVFIDTVGDSYQCYGL